MDFEKTIQLYEKAGQIKKWQDTADYHSYNAERKWYERVRSMRTGEYYQADTLVKAELVPTDWQAPHLDSKGKPVKYPFKQVNSIYRIRALDGSEWLKSRQMWYGLDQAGNPVDQSFDDKETFDEIFPIYNLKPENPKQRDSKMIREVQSIEHKIKYTLPFTAEAAQKLWDMRDTRCNLVIKDESRGDKSPISVESFDQFKRLEFDELWEIVSTPKYKLDRSAKDNLNDAQYG